MTDDNDYKMVLLVRTDLKMGKGKMIAQACHGAVGLVMSKPKSLNKWIRHGSSKITLKVPSLEEMNRIQTCCLEAGIPFHVVLDAGRTQIPADSKTVLAIGPAHTQSFNGITNHLKLL